MHCTGHAASLYFLCHLLYYTLCILAEMVQWLFYLRHIIPYGGYISSPVRAKHGVCWRNRSLPCNLIRSLMSMAIMDEDLVSV